jgi:GTP-binding protein
LRILSAEFVTSATEPSQFPDGALPEIAFAGRSNVGKSSLLNALLGKKGLARVSQTPGRTRLLNFFRVKTAQSHGLGFMFVDLPGYGYAKVSKAVKDQWGPMIEEYLRGRPSLRGLVLLTDIRRGEDEEASLVRWAEELGLGLTVVATKTDKLPRGQCAQALRELTAMLGVPVLGCSATTGEGKEEVWKEIRAMLSRPRGGGSS